MTDDQQATVDRMLHKGTAYMWMIAERVSTDENPVTVDDVRARRTELGIDDHIAGSQHRPGVNLDP